MKLYTKSGDRGMTSIVGGKRVAKTDDRICVCGDIDELNANVGLLLSLTDDGSSSSAAVTLEAIQKHLFDIGTSLSASAPCPQAALGAEWLEREIDRLQLATPEVDTFVLPGGNRSAAQSHVCRTVCRRVERGVAGLAQHHAVDDAVMAYLNRLGDYFFILALNLNFIDGVAEKKLYIPCK